MVKSLWWGGVVYVILVSPQVLCLGFGLSDFGLGLDNKFIIDL